jgi:site-specific DNA-methyltransferase (adenine-specific)
LIKEVYKELDLYLAEDASGILARNLRVPVQEVRAALGDIHLASVRKVIAGNPKKQDGAPYQPAFVQRVWNALLRAAQSSELLPVLEARRAEGDQAPDSETKEQTKARKKRHEDLARCICQGGVATLTGRLRGRVRYAQARNTPFQGLAADGAALALFRLVKEGFKVVGFVHDETLVELPDEGGYVSEDKVRRVEQIKREAMAGVLGCNLPVSVESSLSTCWSKAAKLIVKDGKVYPWSPPQEDRAEGSQMANLAKAEVVPAPAAVVVEASPKPAALDPASLSHEEYVAKALRMAPKDRQDEARARAVQAHRCEVARAAAGADETISTGADVPAVVEVKSEAVPAAGVEDQRLLSLRPAFRLASPLTEMYHGDCRQVLVSFPDGIADLVVTDPPYNIGLLYPGRYDDSQEDKVFLGSMEESLRQVYRVLKPTGSLFLFMGVRLQAEVLVLCKRIGFHFRNTVVWHYTFGPAQKGKFTPSYTPIHYLTKHAERFTFNADRVRVPSARQLKYNDKRANGTGKVPDDVWVLLPREQAPDHFQPDSDVWLESRVCGTFKERVGHVTQLPLALVERMVQVASNPGELVLDPYAGTGTVLVAARQLGRRSIGIELCDQTLALAQRRLETDRPPL